MGKKEQGKWGKASSNHLYTCFWQTLLRCFHFTVLAQTPLMNQSCSMASLQPSRWTDFMKGYFYLMFVPHMYSMDLTPSCDGDFQEEFSERFKNISKIMDCVGCEKCRMWGKLQVLIGKASCLSSRPHCSLFALDSGPWDGDEDSLQQAGARALFLAS